MNNRSIFFIFLLIFGSIVFDSKAGEIIVAGSYQGKNLYVQNPFTGNLQDFCTVEVYVNNTRSNTNLNSSAFEIDLSHFQLNDEVLIKIVHKDDCKPKILNGTVIKSIANFNFVSFSVDDKMLTWKTKSEKSQGKFYLEQFLHNTWVVVSELVSKGGLAINEYSTSEHHHSGSNKYRIRFREPGGQFFYSKVVDYNSVKNEVTFSPKKATNVLNLSHNAHYEIFDLAGVSLLKGSGIQISISGLKPGDYFINIDNKTEKFSKR
jgi:hypothetical protein